MCRLFLPINYQTGRLLIFQSWKISSLNLPVTGPALVLEFTKMFIKNFNRIEIPEYLLPVYFILFAVKFLTVDVFANVPGYHYAAFLPEDIWAAVFITLGVLQFAATYSLQYRFRLAMLFISASFWLLWAGLIIAAASKGFGDIIWSLIAVTIFWTYHRLRHSKI